MSHPLVSGLPPPSADALTLYLFGPAPGESIVVALPGDRWMVVDCCQQEGENLALRLLERFGVKRLSLAALTHPDADHYRGVSEILRTFETEMIWAFPYALTRRDILAGLARRNPSDTRWAGLSECLEVLDRAMSANEATPVYAHQTRELGGAVVHCVAPTPADMAHESRQLDALLQKALEGVALTDDERHLIRGRKLDGSGNGLSLALILEWGETRVCLAGDVEAPADPHRGWNGVLSYAEAQRRGDIFDDITLMKVAHHASEHAFSAPLFERAAKTVRPVALVTPFKGGKNPPPHLSTLRALRKCCARLGVTAEPAIGWSAVHGTEWNEDPRTDDAMACCVVATCPADGDIAIEAHGRARTFAQRRAMALAPPPSPHGSGGASGERGPSIGGAARQLSGASCCQSSPAPQLIDPQKMSVAGSVEGSGRTPM